MCGSASLYIKTLYFFLTVLALSAAVTIANIKLCYDAKIPQFAILGTGVIYVFYSIWTGKHFYKEFSILTFWGLIIHFPNKPSSRT